MPSTMTISDGVATIALPDLVWIDEYKWGAIEQTIERGLTGSQIVHQGTKLAGRPITLEGGERWAWLTRADLNTLKAMGDAVTTGAMTITFLDASTKTVIPDRSGDGGTWIEAYAMPQVDGSELVDKTGTTLYILERLKFLEA